MHFTAQRLSYKETGYFSRLITDYLDEAPALKPFYSWPVSEKGFASALDARQNFPTDRKTLVEVLKQQYAALPASEAVSRNIEMLQSDSTFTITTAHQPAIFTGHLYFVYKILHCVRLAEAMTERFPDKKFVPVFYMGSEDADLDELGHIYLGREKVTWDTKQKGAVGRMTVAGLEKIIQRIQTEYGSMNFGAELVALLKECYEASPDIQTATLKIIHALFGRFGVVVLIADDARLKAGMKAVFSDDLFRQLPYQLTRGTIQQWETLYDAQATPRETNLFYLLGDIRERIDIKGDGFVVNGTSIRFTKESIAVELEKHPERFSPNVILRGLYQATILPDIAFVGGGGETAYWLELKSLFDHYQVPFPVLVLRNSFLLIQEQWAGKMRKAGLTATTIFKKENALFEEEVREKSVKQLDLARELAALQSLYSQMKLVATGVDNTLGDHVESLRSKSVKGIEELEKKIVRAEKRNFEETRRKINELREALFPFDGLQERIENFIPWYAEFGPSFLDALLAESPALDAAFTVLTVGAES